MKHLNPAVLAVSIAFALATQLALADEADQPHPYGAAMGSYMLPDSVRQDTHGFGGHLVYGIPLTPALSVEINGFGTSLSRAELHKVVMTSTGPVAVNDSSSSAQFGLGADLAYRFGTGKFIPFVLGGVGGEWEEYHYSKDEFKWGPFVDVGAGVLAKLTEHLSLRGEVRYYGIYNSTSYTPHVLGDTRVNLGIQYAFFKEPPPPPAPPPPLPPPPKPLPPAKPKCPPAPPGFKVDADGCIIQQTLILRGVNFAFDKDQLTAAARDTLESIASSLAAQSELFVEIDGYTDSIGPDAYNRKLSKERADSVRRYLVSHGVSASHLSTQGLGEADPIASNKTAAGRAENRRVEFKVLNKPPAVTVVKKHSTRASKAAAEQGEPASLKRRKPR